MFCVVQDGHTVELCADVCSSSVVLIVVVPSYVFGIEVACYYCLSHPSPNNRTNTRTHNINKLQLNIDGIRNKIEQLTHFMHTNNIHIILLQETKLRQTHKTPTHYTPLRRDRRQSEGWGLITFIIYHDFLPTPRRGSHVKSGKTHTHSHQDTPLSPYT